MTTTAEGSAGARTEHGGLHALAHQQSPSSHHSSVPSLLFRAVVNVVLAVITVNFIFLMSIFLSHVRVPFCLLRLIVEVASY